MGVENVACLPVGEAAGLRRAVGHGELGRREPAQGFGAGAIDHGDPAGSSKWLDHSITPRVRTCGGEVVVLVRGLELPAYLPDFEFESMPASLTDASTSARSVREKDGGGRRCETGDRRCAAC